MKIKILVIIFIGAFMALSVTGCYTVLMRPGLAVSDSDQVENSQNTPDLEDASEADYSSDYDYFYMPYFGGNSPPPSAFIFYYGTAWWNDSYDTFIETSSDNSLPEPRNFIRRGASAGTESATTVTSGSSGAGGSSAVLTKKSGETSDTNNSNTTNERQTDERREITRRQSPESSQAEPDSKLKRKK